MKPILSTLLVSLSCSMVSCSRPPSPATPADSSFGGDVLALVNGHPIRLADFEAECKRRSGGHSGAFAGPEQQQVLLKEMVNTEALYLRARAAGFDQKPEIARQIKRLIVSRFIESQLGDVEKPPVISDQQVQSYYQEHIGRFAEPARVRFAVIEFRFSSKATAEKKAVVARQAERVLTEARALPPSTRGFGLLAERYSEDQATRYLNGEAGWVRCDGSSRWNPAVLEAAFALKNAGDLSRVITVSNGCYLVKLIEKRERTTRPLQSVEQNIRYQIAQEQRQQSQAAFFDSMKAGLKIQINRSLLESIGETSLPPEAKPPPTPAG